MFNVGVGFFLGLTSEMLRNWRNKGERMFASLIISALGVMYLLLMMFTQFGWDMFMMLIVVGVVGLKSTAISFLVHFIRKSNHRRNKIND